MYRMYECSSRPRRHTEKTNNEVVVRGSPFLFQCVLSCFVDHVLNSLGIVGVAHTLFSVILLSRSCKQLGKKQKCTQPPPYPSMGAVSFWQYLFYFLQFFRLHSDEVKRPALPTFPPGQRNTFCSFLLLSWGLENYDRRALIGEIVNGTDYNLGARALVARMLL